MHHRCAYASSPVGYRLARLRHRVTVCRSHALLGLPSILSFFHTIEQSRAAIPEANVAHPSAHSFLRYWGDRHASALMNWIHGKLEEPNPFKVCAPHDIQHVLRQPPEDECCPVFCLLITMTG